MGIQSVALHLHASRGSIDLRDKFTHARPFILCIAYVVK